MNDNQYPWTILVPREPGVTEVIDLALTQQAQLWHESAILSRALKSLFSPDKLNIAALGNVVSQLHVHHIARFYDDVAWPDPVWGKRPSVPYHPDMSTDIIQNLKKTLESST